ncbi:glycosyltransferase family 9 protein [Varunaivibrio sulfuroxidans]|uniref:ADP-heptose:LPS heptosyltransferase n=1 Tax=Varunaivibrio sulfuroxidans TaxID=1773489 RepID=A0A4R3JAF7_9PROT|nr:glycosyltransferase family 9 protein [Varunaivibrio sulfuroxidans]TCS62612.1 ADP-heptose:LPS heptosyltransferase [Varunaivibrio sulfuroxidans]WES30720.1 glycosyltransferase family 9 protein [Varunaivibrio sulfuroxidans]
MRILFVTSTRIGDGVLSTGLLDHLIARHPGARVTVACGPASAQLFEAVPGIEEIIVLTKKPYSRHWIDLWKRCVGRFWDIVVDLRNAPLTLALFAKRRCRLGARMKNSDRHRVIDLAAVLGLEDTPPMPRLWTSPEHERAARDLVPEGAPVLLLAPSANWRGKVWMAERFVATALRLTADGDILPGGRIAVLGHESERAMLDPVLDALPEERRISLIGAHHLLTIHACLRRGGLFIGNDSGLMHMAAAAGVPTVGLFGPSRPEHYAPWGAKGDFVRTRIPIEGLFPDDYNHRTTESLMDSLSVDDVCACARRLYRRVANG